jgi:hypothetical protein
MLDGCFVRSWMAPATWISWIMSREMPRSVDFILARPIEQESLVLLIGIHFTDRFFNRLVEIGARFLLCLATRRCWQ